MAGPRSYISLENTSTGTMLFTLAFSKYLLIGLRYYEVLYDGPKNN